MTSLKAPLTIISRAGGAPPPAATWFDDDPRHFVALEARPRPPPSTSFLGGDGESTLGGETASLFLHQEYSRTSFVSAVESIDSSLLAGGSSRRNIQEEEGDDGKTHELVSYQAFGIHDGNGNGNGNGTDKKPKPPQDMSAFDAAKKAAQDTLDVGTLATEISVSFPLPRELATIETPRRLATMTDRSVESGFDDDDTYDDTYDDTCSTEQTSSASRFSRRIPILAKFSPRMRNGTRFLVMQYTPTLVRIATVERETEDAPSAISKFKRRTTFPGLASSTSSSDGKPSAGATKMTRATTGTNWRGDEGVMNHWTIDIDRGTYPVVSKPEELPDLDAWGSTRNLFGRKAEEGIVQGATSIIGGGVLWCARGGRGGEDQHQGQRKQKDKAKDYTHLDLVIVTTTSVLIYNMNIVKKQLIKMHVLPHDLAASFWYEPATRTLMIGSYKGNNNLQSSSRESLESSLRSGDSKPDEPHGGGSSFPSAVMAMKTIFFSADYPFAFETLPTFAVGTLRELSAEEKFPSNDFERPHELALTLDTLDTAEMERLREEAEGSGGDHRGGNSVVLPAEIFLVNLYGSVYCVELGSFGSGRGIGLTKLDREAMCIHVKQHNFDAFQGQKVDIEAAISVGVIDNLLCIFSKKDETTHFLDVEDLFSDDPRVRRENIERFDPDMHDESLSFLPPSYFLDTTGQGLLYEIVLSLPLLCESAPPTACIIPSLLRRSAPKSLIRFQIMRRFSTLIESRDMSTLREWMGVVVDRYSKSEAALRYDFESTVTLLSKSSLVSLDGIVDPHDDVAYVDHVMTPASCGQVLCQTEMLQLVLLPHAMSAIKEGDPRKLELVSSLSVHYLVELERRTLVPCAALDCLVLALLWRTGQNAELTSYLSARQTNWTITRRRRLMDLPTSNRMYSDNPGAIAYAESLFSIANEPPFDRASVRSDPSTKRQLISHATIILLGCGATSLAVKCLLSAGQLNDAISICTKKIKTNKGVEDIKKIAEGTQSKDFFRAAVSYAENLPGLPERCKTFYHLYCFLQQWDPSAFKLDSREIRVSRRGASDDELMRWSTSRRGDGVDDMDTVVVEQSILAHECPRFPDGLFGGKETACCQRLRVMFGYISLSSTNMVPRSIGVASKKDRHTSDTSRMMAVELG